MSSVGADERKLLVLLELLLGANQFSEEVVPTVAFNLRHVKRGGVKLKVWDVAGQPKFRSTWQRYCSGVDAVV
jgi:ADP-ribosylation factor-like protein 8